MKVYITRSSKLIATVLVDGVKVNVAFDFGIPADTRKCAFVKDENIQKALEALPDYGSEFWLLEEVVEETTNTVVDPPTDPPANTTGPVADPNSGENGNPQVDPPGTEGNPPADPPAGTTDYPEIKSAQKAKLLMVNELEIATLSECKNAAAIREIAKKHNITFSNWKE